MPKIKILLGVCLLLTSSCGSFATKSVDDRVISVTAADLSQAYENNEVAADATYDGHFVIVSGQVREVSYNALGSIVVNLIVNDNTLDDVILYINSSSIEQAKLINKGSVIRAKCTHTYMVMGSPALNNCYLPQGSSQNLAAAVAPELQLVNSRSSSDAGLANNVREHWQVVNTKPDEVINGIQNNSRPIYSYKDKLILLNGYAFKPQIVDGRGLVGMASKDSRDFVIVDIGAVSEGKISEISTGSFRVARCQAIQMSPWNNKPYLSYCDIS